MVANQLLAYLLLDHPVEEQLTPEPHLRSHYTAEASLDFHVDSQLPYEDKSVNSQVTWSCAL